jgi:hypothetical protein
MGANAQTSVPAFTAGQVLTAAQMTQVNTGIPVFASSTERDAAFGGTGEKTLAEGQYAFLEDTNETQVYDGSSWAAITGGAINLVATATPSAVSSASIDNCFTADYANYLILYQNTAASAANNNLTIKLRASSTDTSANYYYVKVSSFTTVGSQVNDAGTDEFEFLRINTTYPLNSWGTITLFGPAVAAQTLYSAYGGDSPASGSPTIVLRNYNIAGYQSDSTAFDGFTLLAASGTFSGKVLVYGIANS